MMNKGEAQRNPHEGRLLCMALIAAFLLSTAPLIWLGRYAVPAADDLAYGAPMRAAVSQGSLLQAVWAVIRRTGGRYLNWQGSFAAIPLFILQPGVWGVYAITPWVMIIHLTLGTVCFCMQLLHGMLRCMTRWQALSVAMVWMLLNLQLMPVPVEGLYWFNGAVYYTFFYGWLLMLLALMLRMGLIITRKGSLPDGGWSRARMIFAGALGFAVGGGNLVTGLIGAVVSLAAVVMAALPRNRRFRPLCIPAGALLLGFLLNVLAPGNAVRQAATVRTGLFRAMGLSFECAITDFFGSMCLPLLAAVLLILPTLWTAAGRSPLSFRWPGLVTLGGLCLSAAMYFPPIFATSSISAGRIQNIIQYTYFLVLLTDLWYWSGWIQRKWPALKHMQTSLRFIRPVVIVLACVVLVMSACLPGQKTSLQDTTAWEAVREIVSGEAESFHAEEQERIALLMVAEGGEATLRPHSVRPYLLFLNDVGPGQPEWVRKAYETFYGVRISVGAEGYE